MRSVELKNYRIFKRLKISELSQINIIGGLNGVGKTTFLEALFTMIDIGSVNSILRPFGFRRLPSDSTYLFNDTNSNIKLFGNTTSGDLNIEIHCKSNVFNGESVSSKIIPNMYTVEGSFYGNEFKYTYNNGVSFGTQPYIFKKGMMINQVTKFSPLEDTSRLSEIKKNGDSNYISLVENLKLINDDVLGLEIFVLGDQPVIHCKMVNGKTLPAPLLGDGVQTLLSILLAIYGVEDGCVFIDEFESSIHYKLLENIWGIISRVAKEKTCQLFVATHSRECINSAAEGVCDDISMQYIRLDKNSLGDIVPVVYTRDDLLNANYFDAEVR
jgi:AAA15 family ATPase/GTPase